MLELPKIPYKMAKNQSQGITMRGINYSNVLLDGDMADSKNISARAYPYITTREAREENADLSGSSAATVFMGKLAYVKGATLHWGDNEWTISPGAKQFAVVNTKLVIMPDKVFIDGQDNTLKPMGVNYLVNADFGKDHIKVNTSFATWLSSRNCYKSGNTLHIPKMEIFATKTGNVKTRIEVYDQDTIYSQRAHIRFAEPVVDDGVDIILGREEVINKIPLGNSYEYYDYFDAPKGYESIVAESFKVGDVAELMYPIVAGASNYDSMSYRSITIDRIEGNRYYGAKRSIAGPGKVRAEALRKKINVDFSSLRNDGYIYIDPLYTDRNSPDRKWSYDEDTEQKYLSIVAHDLYSYRYYGADVHNGGNTRSIMAYISVGEIVKIKSGTKEQELTVASVDEESITFTEAITIDIDPYNPLEVQKESTVSGIKVGDAITVTGGGNDITFIVNQIVNNDNGYYLYAENEIFTEATGQNITVERRIPDLDFICECNNRIWGCSNKDNNVYGSALGDPTNFFDYSGESTDSYAVTAGSPEDFTGCCRYGNDVLFFKEMKIHKLIGSYPAEYYLYAYDVEGVQRGCEKSLTTINQILYYKGIHGVFAYNGAPTLISSRLGEKKFGGAVAGNNGNTLYMSMADSERNYLFAYETKHGMWVLEDDTRAVDFLRIGGDMYMLREDGKFFRCGAGDSEAGIEWSVQFAPFYETIEGQKSYSRIVLRLDLLQGSHIAVDVRTDGGAWREAGKVVGKRDGIVPVAIPINRCDKFEIRIRGKGKCTIHTMVREFFVGGEK